MTTRLDAMAANLILIFAAFLSTITSLVLAFGKIYFRLCNLF